MSAKKIIKMLKELLPIMLPKPSEKRLDLIDATVTDISGSEVANARKRVPTKVSPSPLDVEICFAE